MINLWTALIAFYIAKAYYIINKRDASCLVIFKQASKINIIRTSPLGLIKLLISLKNINSAKSSLMSGLLVVII